MMIVNVLVEFQSPSNRGGYSEYLEVHYRNQREWFQSPSNRGGYSEVNRLRVRMVSTSFSPLPIGAAILSDLELICGLQLLSFSPLPIGAAILRKNRCKLQRPEYSVSVPFQSGRLF